MTIYLTDAAAHAAGLTEAIPPLLPARIPPGWERAPGGLWWKQGAHRPSPFAVALAGQVLPLTGYPPARYEVLFWPGQGYRWDLAWPARGLAVEVDGGTFMAKGRHTSGTGHATDAMKFNAGILLGWRVLRVPTQWVLTAKGDVDGRALAWLTRALEDT